MRCKQCQYALWNLPGRQCPECGLAFKPSEYVFARGAVAFKCPECEQGYAGTSPKGHLEPLRFHCVRCQADIHMDQTVLVPAAGVAEVLTTPLTIPWIHGAERGLTPSQRWLRTIGMALFSPRALGEVLARLSTPTRQAFRFALINWGAVSLLLFTFFMLLSLPRLLFFGRPGAINALDMFTRAGVNTIFALLPPLVVAAAILLTAHLVIAFAAALQRERELRTAGGIERTFIVGCFASPAAFALALPFFGWPIFLVLHLAIATPMLARAQRVSGGRAAFGTLLLPTLAVPLFFAVVLLPYALSLSRWTAATAVLPTPPPAVQPNAWGNPLRNTSRLRGLLDIRIRTASTGTKAPFIHPADLLVHQGTSPDEFLADPAQAPALTLNGTPVSTLNAQALALEIDRSRARFTPRTVAYRFGDTIFTHFGASPALVSAPEAGELWLLVFSQDPARLADPELAFAVLAAPVSGSVQTIPIERWPEALTEQNQLRATLGLPPLPDVTTLLHDEPAEPLAPPSHAPTSPQAPGG